MAVFGLCYSFIGRAKHFVTIFAYNRFLFGKTACWQFYVKIALKIVDQKKFMLERKENAIMLILSQTEADIFIMLKKKI